MPRPLRELTGQTGDDERATREIWITRRTARSFAAAVSVLLVATLVVNRTTSALTADPANASGVVTSGTIELDDDDQDRLLFDLEDLTPVRPVERCIELTYSGTILPTALAMRADTTGSLGAYLDISIEAGAGGVFESCDEFVPTEVVHDGPLHDLTDRGWVDLGSFVNAGDSQSYRIVLSLQDRQEALGLAASLELAWEVTPA